MHNHSLWITRHLSSFTLSVLSHASQCYLVFRRSFALVHWNVRNHQDRLHINTIHMCTGRHTQTLTTPLPDIRFISSAIAPRLPDRCFYCYFRQLVHNSWVSNCLFAEWFVLVMQSSPQNPLTRFLPKTAHQASSQGGSNDSHWKWKRQGENEKLFFF